jgi:hypothetical protein
MVRSLTGTAGHLGPSFPASYRTVKTGLIISRNRPGSSNGKALNLKVGFERGHFTQKFRHEWWAGSCSLLPEGETQQAAGSLRRQVVIRLGKSCEKTLVRTLSVWQEAGNSKVREGGEGGEVIRRRI